MTLRNFDLKEQVRAYWTARADGFDTSPGPLCAFQGLELGHSKDMMATAIVAVPGTVKEAAFAAGLRVVSTRTARFNRIMCAAPWLAAALVAVVGAFVIWSGLSYLHTLSHDHS